ncbi:helix-turn-helix domain-containing protein [soil metagenome]
MARELPAPATEDIRMTDILRALSDPGRVRMIEVLSDGKLHSTNLSEFPLEVQKSTLSHHFKTLREAGITFTKFEGRNCFVQLRKDDLDSRFPGLLDALLSPSALADIDRGASQPD